MQGSSAISTRSFRHQMWHFSFFWAYLGRDLHKSKNAWPRHFGISSERFSLTPSLLFQVDRRSEAINAPGPDTSDMDTAIAGARWD